MRVTILALAFLPTLAYANAELKRAAVDHLRPQSKTIFSQAAGRAKALRDKAGDSTLLLREETANVRSGLARDLRNARNGLRSASLLAAAHAAEAKELESKTSQIAQAIDHAKRDLTETRKSIGWFSRLTRIGITPKSRLALATFKSEKERHRALESELHTMTQAGTAVRAKLDQYLSDKAMFTAALTSHRGRNFKTEATAQAQQAAVRLEYLANEVEHSARKEVRALIATHVNAALHPTRSAVLEAMDGVSEAMGAAKNTDGSIGRARERIRTLEISMSGHRANEPHAVHHGMGGLDAEAADKAIHEVQAHYESLQARLSKLQSNVASFSAGATTTMSESERRARRSAAAVDLVDAALSMSRLGSDVSHLMGGRFSLSGHSGAERELDSLHTDVKRARDGLSSVSAELRGTLDRLDAHSAKIVDEALHDLSQ